MAFGNKTHVGLVKKKTYVIHSIFPTIQGEATNAGRAATFVRFVGCNVWSGNEKDRKRDTKNGACAAICDTEFRRPDASNGGGVFTAEELTAKLPADRLVVFTGGEPMLQLDEELHSMLYSTHDMAIETNGMRHVPFNPGATWLTLSPKGKVNETVWQKANELKVLFPLYDPLAYQYLVSPWCELWVQPVEEKDGLKTIQNMRAAVDFVQKHPKWRLSVQAHKVWGVQ